MTAPASALDLVGGAAIIGGAVGPGMDMVKLIRRGLPVGAVQFVLDSRRLTLRNWTRLSCRERRWRTGAEFGNLTPEQSDRLIRVARVLAAAEKTFGNQEKAGAWLRRPTRALGGEAHSFSSTPTRGPVRSRPCLDVSTTGSPPEQNACISICRPSCCRTWIRNGEPPSCGSSLAGAKPLTSSTASTETRTLAWPSFTADRRTPRAPARNAGYKMDLHRAGDASAETSRGSRGKIAPPCRAPCRRHATMTRGARPRPRGSR